MGTTERKQRQKAAVRTAILQAAWELVRSDGWQAVSIRKIAEAIDYSVPVIYDHFANKNEILLAFVQTGYHDMLEDMEKARARHAAPEAQLEAMAYAYCDYAQANPAHYQLMFGVGMHSCQTFREVEQLAAIKTLLEQAIVAVAAQYGAQITAAVKFRALWSILHGVMASSIVEEKLLPCDKEREAVLSDVIQTFIKGLQP